MAHRHAHLRGIAFTGLCFFTVYPNCDIAAARGHVPDTGANVPYLIERDGFAPQALVGEGVATFVRRYRHYSRMDA